MPVIEDIRGGAVSACRCVKSACGTWKAEDRCAVFTISVGPSALWVSLAMASRRCVATQARDGKFGRRFHAGQPHVLVGSASGGVATMFDVESGQAEREFQFGDKHDGPPMHAAVSPNSRLLVTAPFTSDDEPRFDVWDLSTGRVARSLAGMHRNRPHAATRRRVSMTGRTTRFVGERRPWFCRP